MTNEINTYIANVAAGGFFASGTVGDFQSLGVSGAYGGLLQTGDSQICFQTTDTAGATSSSCLSNRWVGLQGTTFAVSDTAIPVPAAAWLFGSAFLSLGVARRCKT